MPVWNCLNRNRSSPVSQLYTTLFGSVSFTPQSIHWCVRSLLHFGLGTLWVPTHQYVVMKAVMEKNRARKFKLTDSRVLHLRDVVIVRERGAAARGRPKSSWVRGGGGVGGCASQLPNTPGQVELPSATPLIPLISTEAQVTHSSPTPSSAGSHTVTFPVIPLVSPLSSLVDVTLSEDLMLARIQCGCLTPSSLSPPLCLPLSYICLPLSLLLPPFPYNHSSTAGRISDICGAKVPTPIQNIRQQQQTATSFRFHLRMTEFKPISQ